MTARYRHPDPERGEGEGSGILRFAQNDEWGVSDEWRWE